MARMMKATRPRSVSPISPAATSRSSFSLHAGNCFVFLAGPFKGIVDQSAAYPGSIRRIAASHCSLEFIQPGSKAHGVISST